MAKRAITAEAKEPVDLEGALTTAEVARILRVKPDTIRKWQRLKLPTAPPCIKFTERHVLYPLAQFKQWQQTLKLSTATS